MRAHRDSFSSVRCSIVCLLSSLFRQEMFQRNSLTIVVPPSLNQPLQSSQLSLLTWLPLSRFWRQSCDASYIEFQKETNHKSSYGCAIRWTTLRSFRRSRNWSFLRIRARILGCFKCYLILKVSSSTRFTNFKVGINV